MDPQEQYTKWLDYVTQVPDPRHARGQRYRWAYLLTLLCAGLAAGQKSVEGIAQWARERKAELLAALQPAKPRIPSVATFRRVAHCMPLAELEQQMQAWGAYVAAQEAAQDAVRGLNGEDLLGRAVDGKCVRGSLSGTGQVYLVSLVQHGSGCVLGQARVASHSSELEAVPALLAGRDLHGCVVTADALLTQRRVLRQIRAQGGDYLVVVKENQPGLQAALAELFLGPRPARLEDDRATDLQTSKGHGRLEVREVSATSELRFYLDQEHWPGICQVYRRVCQRLNLKTGVLQQGLEYGVTSLEAARAGPAQLALLRRHHWHIENRVHYVRDESLGEDRCRMRVGNSAQALAALRNGLLTLLRFQGWCNVAAALRHYAASPLALLRLVGAIAT